MMTKVGRLFEEEKIAYGEKLVAEALEQQERKEKQSLMEIAKKMMKRGMSTAEIQGCITNKADSNMRNSRRKHAAGSFGSFENHNRRRTADTGWRGGGG